MTSTGDEKPRGLTGALFGHGSTFAFVLALQAATAVIVLPLLTRTLGTEKFGEVAVGTSVLLIVTAIAPLGLPTVVGWAVYEEGETVGLPVARRLAASTLLISGGTIGLFALTFPLWRLGLGEVGDSTVALAAVLAAVPQTALVVVQGLFQARRRPGDFALCTLVGVIGGYTCGLLVASAMDSSSGYFLGFALGSTAGALIGLVTNAINPFHLASLAQVRAALRHGGPTVVHAMAFVVLAAADRLIVERLMGPTAAGSYHVAYLIGGLSLSLLQALNYAWAALVHSATDTERWNVLAVTTVAVERFITFIVAIVALVGPVAVGFVAPDADQLGLRAVVAWVALAAVPCVWYLASVHILFELKRTGALAWTTPLAAVFNVVLVSLVVPSAGLAGAAASTTAAYVFWAMLVRRSASRLHRQPWDVRASAGWGGAAAAAALAGACLPLDGAWTTARVALGFLVGIGALLTVRALIGAERSPAGEASGGIIATTRSTPEEWHV